MSISRAKGLISVWILFHSGMSSLCSYLFRFPNQNLYELLIFHVCGPNSYPDLRLLSLISLIILGDRLFYVIYISSTTGWTVRGSNPGGARFSTVQIGPGAYPASCTMGIGSLPGVESVRGVTLTLHPLLVPRSNNRVELYLYSP
jgi:hypothetical protein